MVAARALPYPEDDVTDSICFTGQDVTEQTAALLRKLAPFVDPTNPVPPSLLQVERALGVACHCKDMRDNAACPVHAALQVMASLWSGEAAETTAAQQHGYDTLAKYIDAERDDAAEGAVEKYTKSDDFKNEYVEKKELEERDEQIADLQAHVAALEEVAGEEKARELRDDHTTGQDLVNVQYAKMREELEGLYKAKLQGERERADAAETKLRKSLAYKRYAEREIPQPVTLTREQVEAELAKVKLAGDWRNDTFNLNTGKKIIDRSASRRTAQIAVMEYGKSDVTLTNVNLDWFRAQLWEARALQLEGAAVEVNVSQALASIADKPAPTSAVDKRDAYEKARDLLTQPSGLQAMLEICRAQRPGAFKGKGKR